MPEIELPNPHEVREHAEKPFTKGVALCVAIYAVGLAIASFGGHNAAKEMNLAKLEESNRWSQFQAKATREGQLRINAKSLEFEQKAGGTLAPGRAEFLAWCKDEEKRMQDDKKIIKDGGKDGEGREVVGAMHYQHEVKVMQRKDPYFDIAEVAFQLAIVLASVAMLSEKKWAFAISLVLAAAAIVLTINGFGLFVAIPGLEAGPEAVAGH